MSDRYYIASCVFSVGYPELSRKIRAYVAERFGFDIVRCCVPRYKLQEFTDRMPAAYRGEWSALPDCGDFAAGDTVYSLCHNCSAVLEETNPEVIVKSLWELVLSDREFVYPDFHDAPVYVQDCWRAYDRKDEQLAVRELLEKMNFRVMEPAESRERTRFCGISLYRPAPLRNLKLAPRRFVENAPGLFLPHSPERQRELMEAHCRQFGSSPVVCYCHYCHEGLKLGGAAARHLAELLFG